MSAASPLPDWDDDSDLPDLTGQPVMDARPQLFRTISNLPIGRTQYDDQDPAAVWRRALEESAKRSYHMWSTEWVLLACFVTCVATYVATRFC